MKQDLTKKAYQQPNVSVDLLEKEDVITLSIFGTDYTEKPNDNWGNYWGGNK